MGFQGYSAELAIGTRLTLFGLAILILFAGWDAVAQVPPGENSNAVGQVFDFQGYPVANATIVINVLAQAIQLDANGEYPVCYTCGKSPPALRPPASSGSIPCPRISSM